MLLLRNITIILLVFLIKNVGATFLKDDYYGDFFDSTKIDLFSVYLNGSAALRLDEGVTARLIQSLNNEFRIEVTVFIEGGQMADVSILDLVDICSDKSLFKVAVETKDKDGENDLRLVATIRKKFKAIGGTQLKTNAESRISVSVKMDEILLFVDGARVARTAAENIFPLFHSSLNPCIRIFIGTDKNQERLIGFRGGVKNLKMVSEVHEKVFFSEPFANLSNWHILGSTTAVWDSFYRPFFATLPAPDFIPIPRCGSTQCDNPEVVLNYASHPPFQSLKTLAYTLVVVSEDDGSNPLISQSQIDVQHFALIEAFRPYNITFSLNVTRVSRSDLRDKVLIFGCASANVGDGICQKECRTEVTGDDGGDCAPPDFILKCHSTMIRNGKCDPECNVKKFNFDGGDCCHHRGANCIDPKSPYRRYMTTHEYKQAINLPTLPSMIVYFANWPFESLVGLSTFPWETEAASPLGGIILQPHRFGVPGQLGHLIHEIGHILGLWHVHHGVTEVACDDPCFEETASLETGDLVADTPPSPRNDKCEVGNGQFTCGRFRSFLDAPVKNYMSYSLGGCSDHFTPQQVARMHCYIDLMYPIWQRKPNNNHVTIKPRILPKNGNLTLWWPLPLNSYPCRPFAVHSVTSHCTPDRRIVQFGHSASSSNVYELHGFWKPSQATGPPDAEGCTPSVHAWLPDAPNCDESNSEKCILRLWPEFETVVERISIWFTWNAANGVRRIKLIFGDDSERNIDEVFAQCDQPFSFNVYEIKRLKEVQIHINNPFVAVDAIKFISASNDGQCNHCEPTVYRIHRNPVFKEGIKETIENFFEDTEADLEKGYEYSVGVLDEYGYESVRSPPSLYDPSATDYCGDANVSANEECDDGNLLSNDGCSTQCKIEKPFNCIGSPSKCYILEVEAKVCDSSEAAQSCQIESTATPLNHEIFPLNFRGFVAPRSGPLKAQDLKMCELSTFLPPNSHLYSNILANCSMEFSHKSNMSLTLKAEFPITFATHLILSIDPNGPILIDKETDLIKFKISAVFENDSIHDLEEIHVSCSESPLTVNLLPYMTKFKELLRLKAIVLKEVESESLVISSMKLVVENILDLWSIQQCYRQNSLFDPDTGICVSRNVQASTCTSEPLLVHPLISNCSGSPVCRASCAPGFTPVSPIPVIHCSNGEWREFLSKSTPFNFCQQIECEWPTLAFGEAECPKGTGLGQNCTIGCDKNAIFIGNKKNPTIQCLKNGKWSMLEGFCLPTCNLEDAESTRNISKGSMNCRTEISIPGEKRLNASVWAVNSVCRGVCKDNHRTSDTELTKLKLNCGAQGAWLGPSCNPAKCPPPKLVYTGLYNCTDGFNIGSECTYNCPGLHQAKKSRCLSSGSWSIRYPCTVPQKLVCSVPSSNNELIFRCSEKLFAGQSCTTKCFAPGYDVVRESRQLLGSGQTLFHFTPVSTISCTASTNLFPDPANLKCARTCNTDLIGDGWCDFQNNRAYCNWDGGDCCASTARNGKVRYMFPSLCTNAFCQCLDPSSNENYFRYQITNETSKRERKERSNRRLLVAGAPAIKRHWIEKLFHWLDATVSTASNNNNETDLVQLADLIALYQRDESDNIKYSQISKLNFQMRSLQTRKAAEAMRRKLAQTAIESANTELLYKS